MGIARSDPIFCSCLYLPVINGFGVTLDHIAGIGFTAKNLSNCPCLSDTASRLMVIVNQPDTLFVISG